MLLWQLLSISNWNPSWEISALAKNSQSLFQVCNWYTFLFWDHTNHINDHICHFLLSWSSGHSCFERMRGIPWSIWVLTVCTVNSVSNFLSLLYLHFSLFLIYSPKHGNRSAIHTQHDEESDQWFLYVSRSSLAKIPHLFSALWNQQPEVR